MHVPLRALGIDWDWKYVAPEEVDGRRETVDRCISEAPVAGALGVAAWPASPPAKGNPVRGRGTRAASTTQSGVRRRRPKREAFTVRPRTPWVQEEGSLRTSRSPPQDPEQGCVEAGARGSRRPPRRGAASRSRRAPMLWTRFRHSSRWTRSPPRRGP